MLFQKRSIGFDTAVNTITDALNRLTFTASSHDRVMVLEVMGRTAGHLALHSGIAGGADIILIPEIPYSIPAICAHLEELRNRWGRKFGLVVVAEGIKPIQEIAACDAGLSPLTPAAPLHGMGQYIADQILCCSAKPIDIRVSVLGHIQRGGLPLALDRLMAAAFGKAAVDLVAQGHTNQMVAWQHGKVVAVALEEVLAHSPCLVQPDNYLIQTAQAVGIYVGDVSPNATVINGATNNSATAVASLIG